MDDALGLLQTAEQELGEISTELSLQDEKLGALHTKVVQFKSNMYKNDAALGRLDRALRTGKFVAAILLMAIVFSVSVLVVFKVARPDK